MHFSGFYRTHQMDFFDFRRTQIFLAFYLYQGFCDTDAFFAFLGNTDF